MLDSLGDPEASALLDRCVRHRGAALLLHLVESLVDTAKLPCDSAAAFAAQVRWPAWMNPLPPTSRHVNRPSRNSPQADLLSVLLRADAAVRQQRAHGQGHGQGPGQGDRSPPLYADLVLRHDLSAPSRVLAAIAAHLDDAALQIDEMQVRGNG